MSLWIKGQTDAEIVTFLVERYGDFVLYKPPVKPSTYLLWFGPFVLLGLGLISPVADTGTTPQTNRTRIFRTGQSTLARNFR